MIPETEAPVKPPKVCAMSVHLTKSAISKAVRAVAASGKRGDLIDAGCEGLRLRLTPAGGKAWVLACRDRAGAIVGSPLAHSPLWGFPPPGTPPAPFTPG